MRLFVAIELSEGIKDRLCDVMRSLRRRGIYGRYTRKENLHLTLAFIGESERIGDAIGAIGSVRAIPFEIKLSGSGYFGDLLWAGVEKNKELERVARDMCQALREVGFDIENRRFSPHITLVRKIGSDAKSCELTVPPVQMTVRCISLMCSDQMDGGPVYTPVYTRPL